jgi:hypothetical protein
MRDPEILHGVISPWIRDIAKVSKRFTKLVICSECSGAAFTVTYDDIQMNNLYSGYRGPMYTKKRRKYETWYSSEYNAAHESDEFVSKRADKIQEFIQEQGISEIYSILDVGGDRGQYIPNFESLSKRYVLEKSNRPLASGVTRVQDLEELDDVDLIIYAHILEHIKDPIMEIEKLSKKARYVYVEIPFGVPEPSKLRKSRIFQLAVVSASLFPKVWAYLSIPAAGRLTSAHILRQSEHLNFFTIKSMQVIAKQLNLDCRLRECDIPTPDLKIARVIQVFFSQK